MRARHKVATALLFAGVILIPVAAWPSGEGRSPIEAYLETRFGMTEQASISIEFGLIGILLVSAGLLFKRPSHQPTLE